MFFYSICLCLLILKLRCIEKRIWPVFRYLHLSIDRMIMCSSKKLPPFILLPLVFLISLLHRLNLYSCTSDFMLSMTNRIRKKGRRWGRWGSWRRIPRHWRSRLISWKRWVSHNLLLDFCLKILEVHFHLLSQT